ncbi:hypothetical protein ULF88_22075 [Halopseudomonas pachastrellae]|nr:hypothetical protein [Halopseudomonas pachastrellae]
MKKYGKIAAAAAALSLMTGCATGLSSIQEREYNAMQAQGVLVEEKNPTTGAVLGILPGFGSFYAREPGYGFVNLLFWPSLFFGTRSAATMAPKRSTTTSPSTS